jgi:secreted Zn-dependent insulinase-like peptidase
MTYDEYIEKEGVALPISGFEDLVFDYLEALSETYHDLPVEEIMYAIYTTQQLVPHIAEMDDAYVEDVATMVGGSRVH